MRKYFDRLWPMIELWGLRITGVWISLIGGWTLVGILTATSSGVPLWLYAAGLLVGLATLLAGLLTIDRSREDLVLWTLRGVGAGVAAATIFSTFLVTAFDAARDRADPFGDAGDVTVDPGGLVAYLVSLGVALWALRAFGGAFRKRASPEDLAD